MREDLSETQDPPKLVSRYSAYLLLLSFIVYAFFHLGHIYRHISLSKETEGIVVDNGSGWEPQEHYPIVRFKTVLGETIEFQSPAGTWYNAYHQGQTVMVLYDPSTPSFARINTFYQIWYSDFFFVFAFVTGCFVYVKIILQR